MKLIYLIVQIIPITLAVLYHGPCPKITKPNEISHSVGQNYFIVSKVHLSIYSSYLFAEPGNTDMFIDGLLSALVVHHDVCVNSTVVANLTKTDSDTILSESKSNTLESCPLVEEKLCIFLSDSFGFIWTCKEAANLKHDIGVLVLRMIILPMDNRTFQQGNVVILKKLKEYLGAPITQLLEKNWKPKPKFEDFHFPNNRTCPILETCRPPRTIDMRCLVPALAVLLIVTVYFTFAWHRTNNRVGPVIGTE